jgi:hypothetical protein
MYRGLPWLVEHTFVTWHALIGFFHVIYYFTMINKKIIFSVSICRNFFKLEPSIFGPLCSHYLVVW